MSLLAGHTILLVSIFLIGVLLLYFEANRPGMVLPGCTGVLLVLLSLHYLCLQPLAASAVYLSMAGLALVIAEAWSRPRGLLTLAGSVLLTTGLHNLAVPPAPRIGWLSAAALALPFGFLTSWLATVALTARRNKRTLQGGSKAAAIH